MNPVVTRICGATPLKEFEMGQTVNCVVNPIFLECFVMYLYVVYSLEHFNNNKLYLNSIGPYICKKFGCASSRMKFHNYS